MSKIISNMKNIDKDKKMLTILIITILFLTASASLIQSDFGNIKITYIDITNENGSQVTGKLYIPSVASNSSPQPAVLLLHGLNNDKDTEAPTALELARRGIIALALDEINHGNSDSENNNTLQDNSKLDASLGSNAAYKFLEGLGFVNKDKIGLVGHSMGQSSARSTAEKNPNHRAIVFQAFGPVNITEDYYFNNYLQLIPKYEESSALTREEWITEGQDMIRYNVKQIDGAEYDGYDTTYGIFSDGTAQRYALISSTHPGGTWNSKGVKETVAWMLQALSGNPENQAMQKADGQIYLVKELLLLLAMIILVFSSIPIVNILTEKDYFSIIKQETPDEIYTEGRSWWKIATINGWIGGITIMFLPAVGALLLSSLPLFNLFLGNGWTLWFIINALIAKMMFNKWIKSNEKFNIEKLGVVVDDSSENIYVVRRSFLLAVIVFAYFYLFAIFIGAYLNVEFRYMWSFFRILSPVRFIQFLLYLVPIYFFFKYNAGLFLFGQARVRGSILKQWVYGCYNMILPLFILWFIEYIPMILFGTNPLIGGFLYFWLIGIFLMSIIPQFAVTYLLMTILFNKTGRIYLGTFIGTIMTTWILATGVM